MNRILVVEDDKDFLEMIAGYLSANLEEFEIVKASDGEPAIRALKLHDFKLVLTDLHMPNIDGLKLLTYMREKHPTVPAIVMTGFPKDTKGQQVPDEVIRVITKPFDLEDLLTVVQEALDRGSTSGLDDGFAISTLLQLVEMEHKTCIVQVEASDGKRGLFYFSDGEPFDAVYDGKNGQEAAISNINLEKARIGFRSLPDRKLKRRIHNGLMNLLMEASRLQDESSKPLEGGDLETTRPETVPPGEDLGLPPGLPQEDTQETETESTEDVLEDLQEDTIMSLESYLNELKEIKGYKAGAIMNFTGEVLVSNSLDDSVDLDNVGATFNDIFRSAHEASGKVGLAACNEMVIKTPNGIILMWCSGIDSKVHFHMIAIMEADGNQALIKMRSEKLIPKVMKELA